MKIVHVVRQFHPSIGGLEDYVYNLAKEQLSAGYQVNVITLDTDFQTGQKLAATERHDGIDIKRIPWKGSQRYPICKPDVKFLNEQDVVHVHAVDYLIDYLSLLKKLRLLQSKLVLSTHGGFFHTANNRKLKEIFFNTITRFTLQSVDAVVSCSSNDQQLFKKISPDTQLVNNAVRMVKFGVPAAAETLTNDMVYLGRFSSNKRVSWLINEFAKIPNPPGHLKIIGQSRTGETAEMLQLVESLNCQATVKILLDLDDQAIAEHIVSSKFTVSASEYEGFGLSVVELMSYGLVPLLADDPLTFNDFIKGSGTGHLFNIGSSNFADHYQALVDDWSPAEAQKAREYSKQFSWKATSAEMTNVYKSTFDNRVWAN